MRVDEPCTTGTAVPAATVGDGCPASAFPHSAPSTLGSADWGDDVDGLAGDGLAPDFSVLGPDLLLGDVGDVGGGGSSPGTPNASPFQYLAQLGDRAQIGAKGRMPGDVGVCVW